MPLHECFHVPVTSCQRAEVKAGPALRCNSKCGYESSSIKTFQLPNHFHPNNYKFKFLKKISKACADIFTLWNLNLFNRLFFFLFQCFHTETDLTVFDTDNLYLYFLSHFKYIGRKFHTLLGDLRYMDKTGQTILKLYKSTVILKGLNGSFQYRTNLNTCDQSFTGFFSFSFSSSRAERTRRLFA